MGRGRDRLGPGGQRDQMQPADQARRFEALRLRATDLAAQTRLRGLGQIHGTNIVVGSSGGGIGRGFIMGADTREARENNDFFTRMIYSVPSEEQRQIDPMGNREQQVWTKTAYNPRVKPDGGFVEHFVGMHGEADWARYIYYMPTLGDGRRGNFMELVVAVPKDIAEVLDSMVIEDPRFVDLYFNALYPEILDEQRMRVGRFAAKELRVQELVGGALHEEVPLIFDPNLPYLPTNQNN